MKSPLKFFIWRYSRVFQRLGLKVYAYLGRFISLDKHKQILINRNPNLTDLLIYERRISIGNLLSDKFDYVVQSGVFKGLKLDRNLKYSGLDRSAMLLGLYEYEVLQILENGIHEKEFVINLGVADGYYLVGLAKALLRTPPQPPIFSSPQKHFIDEKELDAQPVVHYGFEQDLSQKVNILKLAEINGLDVGSFEIFGSADKDWIDKLPPNLDFSKSIIIVDIEGDEYEIMNSHVFEKLKGALIIIEVHEFKSDAKESIERMIRNASSFKSKILKTSSRDLSNFTDTLSLDDIDRWLICPEGRGINSGKWLILE
jgi:hypothetical protein